jgi:ATP-independent RNA helicase DbpA
MQEMHYVGRIEAEQGSTFEFRPLAELTRAAGAPLVPPMVTLQILGGRREKIRAGDVLGALTGTAGFSAAQIGKINVNELSTYVAVERGIAQIAAQRLSAGKVKGKTVKVRILGTDVP